MLRPWSAFCTQKHSFQQNRKQSTFTEAEKLALCYSLGKQRLHTVTCRHYGTSSAPDVIPTTFPFSSCFWESSSVQKWVNNFYPPAHFGRLSSFQSTSRFQGELTTPFYTFWRGKSIAVSTTLWEADPPFHQQQSGSAREVTTTAERTAHACLGIAAIYPYWHGALLSTTCDLLELLKT